MHGVVREVAELTLIASHGVNLLPLHAVLSNLRHAAGKLKGGAGTDLAEIIEYYNTYVVPTNKSGADE